MNHLETGRAGEDFAAFWLSFSDLIVLERNWRSGRYEVDFIASDRKTLVFIEVKTRTSEHFEFPEDAVTPAKQKNLSLAADAYCQLSGFEGPVRFDVISVILSPGRRKLIHYKDVL